MKNSTSQATFATVTADALVLPIWSEGDLPAVTAAFDQASGGLVKRLQDSRVTGKAFETTLLYSPAGVAARNGADRRTWSRDKFNAGQAYRTAGTATKFLASKPRMSIAFAWSDVLSPELTEAAVAGAMNGAVGQIFIAKTKRLHRGIVHLAECRCESDRTRHNHGESIQLTRRLINEPPQEIYPETFANHASELAKEHGISCEVWDQARLEKERCGSLLAVAKGSSRPPRLVILKYSARMRSRHTWAWLEKVRDVSTAVAFR